MRKRFMNVLITTLGLSLIYFIFTNNYPEVLWVALGVFIFASIKELVVIFYESRKKED